MRTAAKPDGNQAQVVKYLRDLGFTVGIIRQPADLLVALRAATIVVEVKNPKRPPSARHLTQEEMRFYLRWTGSYAVVEDGTDCRVLRDAAANSAEHVAAVSQLIMWRYFETCYTPAERAKQAQIHGKAWTARMQELGVA